SGNPIGVLMISEKLSLTCDRLLSHQQLACSRSFCAAPLRSKEVCVHPLQPLLLTGHHGDINAMTFGKRNIPVLLCSASADYVIVWDVENCQRKIQEGEIATGLVIGTLLGEVIHLSFCFSDERVAACSGAVIYVLNSKKQKVICTLTGHLGPLTSAEFCPWDRNILVSTSEDRTFKVWDLKTEAVLYQSFVLSASPLLSALFLEKNRHLITGSADGQRQKVEKWRWRDKPAVVSVSGCLNSAIKVNIWTAKLYKKAHLSFLLLNVGHDKPVSSVSWSLSRQWLLSASDDRSVRIWTNGSSVPAITMGDNMFSKPVRGAQFYYLDKFLLLASGPALYLYLYDVDTTRDDIKTYKQRSVFKLASCITTSTGITALSAINGFLSYIVLVSGSDRSIQVLDMNKGSVASVLPDAHSRATHCITQNKGSAFTGQTPESYNLFLSSAITDGVKLWDLRTLRCVRRYENHVNRCHPCSSAFSPCGRFIVCGSEDKCAYIYDIRSSTYLHRLQRHSDTVLSVAFNPATPEVWSFHISA
uniref:WD repeat domain 27 n=1 Tax=Nothobranchius furzeri TaxID=105023 RepID=A0A8C6KNE8_NOTFU